MKDSIQSNWSKKQSEADDTDFSHRSTNEEFSFYVSVANGDLEAVEQNCREGHFYKMDEGVGILSRDPVLNLKYHFVITMALVTRFCCEAGMEKEHAFRLSDFYISQLDNIATREAIIELHDYAVMDFCKKMKSDQRQSYSSKPVNEALNYIYSHINERLTIEDVALALDMSESYLSRLFKSETGVSFSDYVREEKIKRAVNLLRFSEYTLTEIATYLGFSSQSHFTQLFKKSIGMTPKAYRDSFYQTHWMKPTDDPSGQGFHYPH